MKFVLIGQSVAVIAAVKTIRGKDPAAEIVILSCDGHLPYDRFALPQLISRQVKEKAIFLETEEFFKAHQVTVILDKEMTRINFNRRRIFLAEKQSVDPPSPKTAAVKSWSNGRIHHAEAPGGSADGLASAGFRQRMNKHLELNYDVLIMADAPSVRLPGLKGIRRTGVFNLARLESVKGLLKHLPFIETAVITPSSVRGLETALALKDLGKDVLVSVETERLLAGVVDEVTSAKIATLLEKKGIRIALNSSFEDILGEVEVKAVRFKTGKVVACEAVIFEDLPPDLRFLEEGDLVMGERVPVTGTMATNVPNVYAVDALCQMESPKLTGTYSLAREDSERQGEVAALAALGEPAVYDRVIADGPELLKRASFAEELSETVSAPQAAEAGNVLSAAGASSEDRTDPASTGGG